MTKHPISEELLHAHLPHRNDGRPHRRAKARKLAEEITPRLGRDPGGSPESVDILITDVKRENWATAVLLAGPPVARGQHPGRSWKPPTRLSTASRFTDALMRLLRLKTHPLVALQMFERVEDMQAAPFPHRRPDGTIHTADQIVGQAARLPPWASPGDDLVGPQCSTVSASRLAARNVVARRAHGGRLVRHAGRLRRAPAGHALVCP